MAMNKLATPSAIADVAAVTAADITDDTGGTAATNFVAATATVTSTVVNNNFATAAADHALVVDDITELRGKLNSVVEHMQNN